MKIFKFLKNKNKNKNKITFFGDEEFKILKYRTIEGKKYVKIRATVKRPNSKIIIFEIPEFSEEIKKIVQSFKPVDGYTIIINNNSIQEINIYNLKIYDRIKDGF